MATSTAMPTSFRESFSTSSMKPFSSVTHSSRWKINNFVAKQNINDKENKYIPSQKVQSSGVCKEKNSASRSSWDRHPEISFESNVTKFASNVIQKTNHLKNYNLSAYVYTQRDENYSCLVNNKSGECIVDPSTNILNSEPLNDEHVNDNSNQTTESTIDNIDWRASLKKLQAEIKKVTELPDIITKISYTSKCSSTCDKEVAPSTVYSGTDKIDINTDGTERNKESSITSKENNKIVEAKDSETSIVKNALDIREKYRNNRTIEKLKNLEILRSTFPKEKQICEKNEDANVNDSMPNIQEVQEIQLNIPSLKEDQIKDTKSFEEIETLNNAHNDSNSPLFLNNKLGSFNDKSESEFFDENNAALKSIQTEDQDVFGCVQTQKSIEEVSIWGIEHTVKVSEVNIFTEKLPQDEILNDLNAEITVTILLELNSCASKSCSKLSSYENTTTVDSQAPRKLQRQRGRFDNIHSEQNHGALDWREELKQRERAKREKKYGLNLENKTVESGETTEQKGPGYRPPETSCKIDWRNCLSSTRDLAVPNLSKTGSAKNNLFAKYLPPPPPTAREKWKSLDKASNNSPGNVSGPHDTRSSNQNKLTGLKDSVPNQQKVAKKLNTVTKKEDWCNLSDHTTIKVINFVAIKVKENSIVRNKTIPAKSSALVTNKIDEDRNAKCSDEASENESNTYYNRPEVKLKGKTENLKPKEKQLLNKEASPIREDIIIAHCKTLTDSPCTSLFSPPQILKGGDLRSNAAFIPEIDDTVSNICMKNLKDQENIKYEDIILSAQKEAQSCMESGKSVDGGSEQKLSPEACTENTTECSTRKSPLIFSEVKSNFVTDTFLLNSMFGDTYVNNVSESDIDSKTESSSTPSPSFQGSWRTRLGSVEPPGSTKPLQAHTTSPFKLSEAKRIDKDPPHRDRLNQSIIDIRKARARDTISNVLYKHKGLKY